MGSSLTLRGAAVLRPHGFDDAPLAFSAGVIRDAAAGREIFLPGCQIVPGIVDLHGDAFEKHLAPRRGLMAEMTPGLVALDAELGASGITTAVLAQFWSWEGGMRGPGFARRLAAGLDRARPRLLTDMVMQLRLETHLVDDFDDVAAFVEAAGIGYVVFNDHLPHDALGKGKRPPALTGQALKAGRNPEAHHAMLRELHGNSARVPQALATLAARLRASGVRLGSHDDRDFDTRARFRAIGAAISEFPETLEAARAAKAGGDPVLLGAPNVVRGGSHKRNMSVAEAVSEGLCDALVSDYHYPSPLLAAQRLAREGMAFARAWALVSSGPAAVMGLKDRGNLAPGQRADLVVLDAEGQVGATFAGGRLSFARGAVAAALLG